MIMPNTNTWSQAGQKANDNQYGVGGDNPFVDAAKHYQSQLWGGIAQGGNFAAGMEGQRENLINQIVGQLSPGGIQASAARQRNSIMENAANAGNQAAMALSGQGYGSGAAGGLLGAMFAKGAAEANASDAKFNDPSYVASVLGQGLGAVNEGMQNPLLGQAAALEPEITQQEQINYQDRGQGLFGQLAPLAGQFFGSPDGQGFLKRAFTFHT